MAWNSNSPQAGYRRRQIAVPDPIHRIADKPASRSAPSFGPKGIMHARIGESFEHTETLDEGTISGFAHLIGDLNPLHHERRVAAASRFGGIIASGPHCASILLAQAANYFSRSTSMVGLEFFLKFQAPARPGDVLRFRWEIIDVLWSEKLRGDIVSLAGSVSNSTGTEILTSQGKVLVFGNL